MYEFGNVSLRATDLSLSDGQWHHVVVRWTGGLVELVVDHGLETVARSASVKVEKL